MFHLLEGLTGQRPVQIPDNLVTVNLLSPDPSNKKLLQTLVRRNSGLITALVHPYFRENSGNGQYPFPLTSEYVVARDGYIKNAVEGGKPLVIFEEAAKCPTLATRITARKGVVYWVATCDGDATPATIMNAPGYRPVMHSRARVSLEEAAWDEVGLALKEGGSKHLKIGGRYMVLHEPHADDGNRFLKRLKEAARGKRNAREMLDENLVPGGCPGQVMIAMLRRGFDVSISDISSPTNTLTPTDLTNYPDLRNFY